MRGSQTRRSGQTLVLFVLILPALLGMIGLMVDGGLLMAAHRQAQNAADAAALAGALDLMRNKTGGQVIQTAKDFVLTYNSMSTSTVTCSGANGPSKGPYAGNK